MNCFDVLEKVKDRDSFFKFVEALIKDREAAKNQEREKPSNPYGPDAGGWENVEIETYLEAALAWAETTRMGASQGLPEAPTWMSLATFLYMGKIYE